MRRSPNRLQVSTFPFLAVLLCAMGALILFLLVMDRRGKIVAAAKGRAAREAQLADRSKEDAARNAEWEQQRDALHQTLLAQKQQLGAETTEADKLLAQARRKVQAKQAELDALQRAAEAEGVKVADFQLQIKASSAGAADNAKLAAAAKIELDRLCGEVADLEKVLTDLKSLKKQETSTYSLVPYRGKHGDSRRPIYVECAKGGVVLHPERRVLAGLEFNALALRGEIERRAGGLEREAKKSKDPNPGPPRGPYVLFLVRPDGIGSYYEALSFLKGFEIDFGYEVVNQHWALDFSKADLLTDATAPGALPAPAVPPTKPSPFTPLPPAAVGSAVSGPSSPNSPGSAIPNNGAAGSSASLSPPPVYGQAASTVGGPTAIPSVASPGTSTSLSPPPPNRQTGSPGAAPVWSGTPSQVPASNLPPAEPLVKAGPGLPFGGVAVGSPQPGSTPNPNGQPGQGSGIPSPWQVPGTNAAPAPPGPPGPPSVPSSASVSTPPPVSPLQGSAPVPPASKGPPQAIRPVLGNRDFVITIACYGDHVNVYPGGKQFSWQNGNSATIDQAVVQNVQDLIAGRQKSVRPGEPPYRPMIRFQLAPGGLIRFLHLYPRLEFLQVPMTRENLDD